MDLLSSVYAEIPCVAPLPRIVNHSDDSITVSVRTFDDSGRAFGSTTPSGFLTNVHDKVRKPNRTGRLTHE